MNAGRLTPPAALLALAGVLAGCAAGGAPVPPRAAGPAVLRESPAGGGVRFLGSDACQRCHAEAFAFWRTTRHAASLASLEGTHAGAPACLRCHVTGYGDPLGYGGSARAEGLAAVGCEACHGAGGDHAASRYPELVPTATGGDCPPCEVNRICRSCHTAESAPGFDLGRDLPRVACRPGRTR